MKSLSSLASAKDSGGKQESCSSSSSESNEKKISENINKKPESTESTVHCASTLYLVDLAGSERVTKSKVANGHLNEAIGINKSLLALGKVISSLVKGKAHIPYLESKLTTLLKNAFGGNCRTNVIVHCRPDDIHADETLQTMRFGERCSMIMNKTKTAAKSKESALETIDEAIDRLQNQLLALKESGKGHLQA